MWTSIEIISVCIGSIFTLAGLLSIVQGFMNTSRIASIFGDECLVYADAGTYNVGRRAFRIREIKRNSVLTLIAALGLLGIAILKDNWSFAWLIGMLAGVSCMDLSMQMVPGCLLILGRSETDTIATQARINKYLTPFRAISLLQTKSEITDIHFKAHCFRVGPNDNWVEAVETLCSFLPIIILDLRDSSGYVEKEISIVLEKNYLFKTIFITLQGERESFLKRLAKINTKLDEDTIMSVADDVQCISLLNILLFDKRIAPLQEKPLWEILKRCS